MAWSQLSGSVFLRSSVWRGACCSGLQQEGEESPAPRAEIVETLTWIKDCFHAVDVWGLKNTVCEQICNVNQMLLVRQFLGSSTWPWTILLTCNAYFCEKLPKYWSLYTFTNVINLISILFTRKKLGLPPPQKKSCSHPTTCTSHLSSVLFVMFTGTREHNHPQMLSIYLLVD